MTDKLKLYVINFLATSKKYFYGFYGIWKPQFIKKEKLEMQVQKVNNQQPNFGGNVVRLEVKNPEVLEDIKGMAKLWQGDKNAPFSLHFQDPPFVTIFMGAERNRLDKVRAAEARVTKKTFSNFKAKAFTKAYMSLMELQKVKESLLENLESRVKPIVINSSLDLKRIDELNCHL